MHITPPHILTAFTTEQRRILRRAIDSWALYSNGSRFAPAHVLLAVRWVVADYAIVVIASSTEDERTFGAAFDALCFSSESESQL